MLVQKHCSTMVLPPASRQLVVLDCHYVVGAGAADGARNGGLQFRNRRDSVGLPSVALCPSTTPRPSERPR
jgi:hypothetical protein